MTKTNETTAYNLAFASANDLPVVAEAEVTDAPSTSAETKRTDRPATAILPRWNGSAATSAALEMVRPVDARLAGEVARKIKTPLTNLADLFHLVMDDLDALPILQSEMLWEIKPQLTEIEKTLELLDSHSRATAEAATPGADGQVAANALADLVFTAMREIRTPVANMQGLLSLVMDDRSALPGPVAEMLLLAYEQLEKLAKVIDEVSETANVFNGHMDVRTEDAALDQIIAQAVEHAQEEGFEYELVRSNQVPAELLPEIAATAGQCLETLIRHALLDTMNYPHEMPVGLFVYVNEAEAPEASLVIEVHDYSTRPAPVSGAQQTLDQQVVLEMAHALSGQYRRAVDASGEVVSSAIIPIRSFTRETTDTGSEAVTVAATIYQGLALLSPARRLTRVVEDAVANRLQIQRVANFAQMVDALKAAYLPTIFIDADLLQNVTGDELAALEGVMQVQTNVFVLQHGETDVGGAAAMFPMLWDDDLLAITGMLEQPFKPGTQQENLMLITGDNTTEVRPWRKLLSSTGNGSMWWPAARTIPTDRFPSMIGGVVVVAESTRALPVATWNALSDLSVRDRKIIVLTGTESCKLPRARGWDIYRPNLNVCDDTLRRYILFNSPTQNLPRVAVIEDDILMRKLLVSTIEDQAQIVEMGSVQEALTNLRTMAFDVILLDLFLPDGSGLEILKAIQSDSRLIKARSTPIVALTGSSDLELNQTVLNEGATEVLVKPMPMQVLRQKIAVLTRQNRSRRLSGPVATQPAAAATTANTPAVTEPDLPVVPAAPRRLAGMSKIISLRALAAASSQAQPVARECAVGD